MRPIHTLVVILLFLGALTFSYVAIKGLKMVDEAAGAANIQHQTQLADMIRSACLNYGVEYGRLPPDSDNQRLTAALTGENARHIAFLSLSKNQLNANNQMIDRWGTPIKVTFQGASGIQVTSAGPDKVFGTSDDIVSNSAAKN